MKTKFIYMVLIYSGEDCIGFNTFSTKKLANDYIVKKNKSIKEAEAKVDELSKKFYELTNKEEKEYYKIIDEYYEFKKATFHISKIKIDK